MRAENSRRMAAGAVDKAIIIRVLVADQHPVIRIGVENVLHAQAGISVIGEAGNGDEAIEKTRELSPDILLLALNLPSLEVMRPLVNISPGTRTILLSNVISHQEVLKALQLGARGIVMKDALMDNLISAIRAVSAGRCWMGSQPVAGMAEALHSISNRKPPAPVKKKSSGLTPRELEIVGCVVKGCSNRDIAQQFQLSEETVKRHLSNIFEKTGVSTRLELALFALEHQLVASPS